MSRQSEWAAEADAADDEAAGITPEDIAADEPDD
jgi:hypothetical protein